MLVIKIELWPGGSPRGMKLLGLARIWNDGSGDISIGNYEVQVLMPESEPDDPKAEARASCRIEGWPRRRGVWFLLEMALRQLRPSQWDNP